MSSGPAPISAEARRALEQELADLRAERGAVAETLGSTDPVGDPADQADELQRATEVARLDSRIDEITARLRDSAEAGPPRTDVVGVGSTVTVRFPDEGVQTVLIGEVAVGSAHTLVTADSPLGLALLGRRAGDAVSWQAPDGPATAVVVSIGDGE
ncbi:GreA/GreB family elongation factor [Kitasatospora sp. NBC_00070]|uniref:GreA/GreB family elongation factor n=1 Tax=Kitasatospora sp. NBC_00070 TaxID=2975962 RepID=UPI003255E4CB